MPPAPRRLLPASTLRLPPRVPRADKTKRVVACLTCREKRRKCSGLRPTCDECCSHDVECKYEFLPGVTRAVGQKLKQDRVEGDLSTAMELYWYLQTQSKGDVTNALNLIQSGLKPGEVLKRVTSRTDSPEAHSFQRTASSALPSRNASITLRDRESSGLELNEVSLYYPSNVISALDRGIKAFFLCMGRIFHIYNESDAEAQLEAVRPMIEQLGEEWSQPCQAGSPTTDRRYLLCSVCIIAAIGLQYTKDPIPALDFQPSRDDGTHQYVSIFYNVAKHHLDDLIERDVLEAMRACAAFCVFNTIGHATIALNYAYMGVNVAFNNGLPFRSNSHGLDTKDRLTYKRVLRTLSTLHDWMVSTLGSIPQHNVGAQARVQWLEDQDAVTPSEIIQRELAKLVHVEAGLLHTVASSKGIPAPLFAQIRGDLLRWHEELPGWMHLGALVNSDVESVGTKRTIYLVHLFYLSANILVARLAHDQLSQSESQRQNEGMKTAVGEGLIASRTASRILQLQLDERTIFQRCWCCEFAAYMSCIVLLHSTTQMVLSGRSQSIWRKELSYAKSCIDVLEYCGRVDKVALCFFEVTNSYYTTLLQEEASGIPLLDDDSPLTYEHLFENPTRSRNHLKEASADLIDLLIRPFGSPPERSAESTQKPGFGTGVGHDQDPFMTLPFNITMSTRSDRVYSLRNTMCSSIQNSRFMGSKRPHNWSSILDTDQL